MKKLHKVYHFSANTLPDFIDEPLQYLSVVAKSELHTSQFVQALRNSFYFSLQSTDKVLPIYNALQASGSRFHSVKATSGSNHIVFSSKSPHLIHITLDEHTLSHHSYVSRYFKFTKHAPPKEGSDTVTFFKCDVDRRESANEKDFLALIEEVFSEAHLSAISDVDLGALPELSAIKFQNMHEKSVSSLSKQMLDCPGSSASAFAELQDIEEDESQDAQEHLTLLHLNAIPDVSNSHVAATLMYEPPSKVSIEHQTNDLYLASISDVSPHLFYEFVNSEETLSVMARTRDRTFLVYRSGENSFFWDCRY